MTVDQEKARQKHAYSANATFGLRFTGMLNRDSALGNALINTILLKELLWSSVLNALTSIEYLILK